MKGNDFFYIGLGVAALYAVYKIGKPIEETGQAVADTATSAGNYVQGALYVVNPSTWEGIGYDAGQQTRSWFDNIYNTVSGWI